MSTNAKLVIAVMAVLAAMAIVAALLIGSVVTQARKSLNFVVYNHEKMR